MRVFPNPKTKRNYGDTNQDGEKAVHHLQPDLECVHIPKSPRIAPGIDFCQRARARVWNPRAVRSWKIKNRQIFVLMSHGRAERELRVDRDRRHNGDRSDDSKPWRNLTG